MVCSPTCFPPSQRKPQSRIPSPCTACSSCVSALSWERAQLRSSKDVASLFRTYLGDTDREHFLVAMLDQKNKVIGINLVSTGSLTASVVHPRECLCAVCAVVVYRYQR